MIENLPIPVTPDSELGRLLVALEAAEAAAMAQRLIWTAAREAFRNAAVQQRRSSYLPSQSHRTTAELEAEHELVLELQRTRDREDRKLQPLMDELHELRERFSRDYTEFYRLHVSMAELQRLGG